MLTPGEYPIIDPPDAAGLRAYAYGMSGRACVNGLGLLLTITQQEAAGPQPLQVVFHTEAFTESGTVAFGQASLTQPPAEKTSAWLCMDGVRALGCLVVSEYDTVELP